MIIVGIDEVGRGCWAGPLVAAAVALREPIEGLKDSKKLTKKQREAFTGIIKEKAAAIGIGWVDSEVIDEIGLTASVEKAMRQALEQVKTTYDEVIIDGHINFLPDNPKTEAVIKADDSVPEVSAASIIAKVARDDYMAKAAVEYPGYGFEKHVGYGTAFHLENLKQRGVTKLHRRSFAPIRSLAQ